MIGQKTLSDYGFSHEHDYYDYIIESYINGQKIQVKELFSKCSPQQRKDCLRWVRETQDSDEIYDYLFKLLK